MRNFAKIGNVKVVLGGFLPYIAPTDESLVIPAPARPSSVTAPPKESEQNMQIDHPDHKTWRGDCGVGGSEREEAG